MNITFIIYSLSTGGAERAVTGLANHWANGGHAINILTLIKSEPFYTLDKQIGLRNCLESPQTRPNALRSLINVVRRINILINQLKAGKPDVVISFMHTSNIYALLVCKWLNIPCIISERANHAVDHLPVLQERIRNWIYPKCASLVVQTKGNQKYYTAVVKKEKINIVPNAVATVFKPLRKGSGHPRQKTILNVGSFKNGKAQDVLIKAFAQLPAPDWQLIFLGKGHNLENFKALAQKLGVADRITFDGAQKDVAAYYNNAGIFVFTSEHEGFPNALLEALYFGLPSISTDCPHGPADMITDGENGFLVPVGDVETLTKKMELLMNDEVLQQSFGIKAIESTKKYEMEHIAAQWMQVIQEVVKVKNVE